MRISPRVRATAFLAAAVASAQASYAAPKILYELTAPVPWIAPPSGSSLKFYVCALVAGKNATAADDSFSSGQFSLVQLPSGYTGATLSFNLFPEFSGSVPQPSNGNLGAGTSATGSPNDTIIAQSHTTTPVPYGTETVGGTAYNLYVLGQGSLSYLSKPGGFSPVPVLSVVPRSGSDTDRPQTAYIDGSLTSYRGDDAANVGVVGPLSIRTGYFDNFGDINGDGFIDYQEFGIVINHYFTFTIRGYQDGDYNEDGWVDSSDFGFLINNYLTGPNPHAGLEPSPNVPVLAVSIPEPASVSLLAVIPLLARRRRSI